MTDADKLYHIELIAREAFGDHWQGKPEPVITAHRLQALANIFAIFEYDGMTCGPVRDQQEADPDDDGQVTFDDLLGR